MGWAIAILRNSQALNGARVALARALAVEPQVLLLDEPFGALDAKVRKELRTWLRRLHDEVGVTAILVTHDQEEAMEVSNEIVVMNKGRVEQVGSAAEIYDRPATPFAMSFIGPVNVLPRTARLFQDNRFDAASTEVFLRPHDVVVDINPHESKATAIVSRVVHLGWEIEVELVLEDGQSFKAVLTREKFDQLKIEPQQLVYVKPNELNHLGNTLQPSGRKYISWWMVSLNSIFKLQKRYQSYINANIVQIRKGRGRTAEKKRFIAGAGSSSQ